VEQQSLTSIDTNETSYTSLILIIAGMTLSSIITVLLVLLCRRCLRKKTDRKISIAAKSPAHRTLNSSLSDEVDNIPLSNSNNQKPPDIEALQLTGHH